MSTEDFGPTAGPSAIWIGPIELYAKRTFVGDGYASGRLTLNTVPFRHGSEDYRTAAFVTQHIKQEEIDAGQTKLLKDIEARTQEDLDAAVALMGTNEKLSSLEIIQKLDHALNTLIAVKSAEAAEYTRKANEFYGSSPLNKDPKDFIKRFYEIQNPVSGQEGSRAFDTWQASYEAASAAKIVNASIDILKRKQGTLWSAKAAAAVHAARAGTEPKVQLLEQPRFVGQKFAPSQANAKAPDTQQQIGKTSLETNSNAIVSAETAPKEVSANLKAMLAAPALIPSTQSAVGALTAAVEAGKQAFVRSASRALVGNPAMLAMLYSPYVADGERPSLVFGTPLSQLNLSGNPDLEYVARVKGTIDVPHRMVVEGIGENSAPKWVVADGVKVGTKVRVRALTYNAKNNTYEFTRDGDTAPSLVWTPIARPDDSSTSSPATPPLLPADPGTPIAPVAPELETYPEVVSNDPDDYILKGPDGSGLPDTYLLFKDPRTVPGIATGYGKPVTGTWLGDATRSEGAPIPSHIADQLRGEKFSTFDRQREAIWKAVASDPALSKQFGHINLELMRRGRAPLSPPEDRVGGRKKFEVHHLHEVGMGGNVYDMDNLGVMTPIRHIEHHKGAKQ